MRTRDYVLEYQKALDDTGTLIKDIDIIDPVSALYLEFEGTNGSTSNEDNFMSDVITKVEIVDGSEVLYSLSLAQLEALHFYKTKKSPVLFPSEWANGSQRHGCYLLFGRHLWDREYAMDFTKFRNPQLRITTNIAAVRAASETTAIVSESLKGSVIAKIMEDVPATGKYLMAKEVEAFTSVGSGYKRVDLPRDYKYRMLMLRAFLEGYDTDEVISAIKLTCDSDKYVMMNRQVKQLDSEAEVEFGEIFLRHNVVRATDGDIRGLLQKETQFAFFPSVATQYTVFTHQLQFSGTVRLGMVTEAGASAGTRRLWGWEIGHALHATLPIPFGLMDEPDTWFDPTAYGKVEAVLDDDTAAASCQVCLEQERPL